MSTDLHEERPKLSALSQLLHDAGARTSVSALPLEVFHNLRQQHEWTDFRIKRLSSKSNADLSVREGDGPSTMVELIVGLPPRHIYMHPDFQAHLIQNKLSEADVPIHHEWVLPLSLGEKWTLSRFADIFDALPRREPLTGVNGFEHTDSKRVLLAMLAHNGMGGDGTITWYVMQEGDVKPRQN